MGEDTNLIEQDIRQSRSELGRNLDELGDKARDLVSWRAQYRDHSRVFLGAAFGAGLILGLAAISSRNGTRRLDDGTEVEFDDVIGAETYAIGAPVSGLNGGMNGVAHDGTVARARREIGETWGAIADGLVRTVSARAVQWLTEMVPGFSDHIEGRYAASHRTRVRE